jgi:hypothetical protein
MGVALALLIIVSVEFHRGFMLYPPTAIISLRSPLVDGFANVDGPFDKKSRHHRSPCLTE